MLTVEQIIKHAQALPLDERQQLREQLNALADSPTEDALEDAFERELVAEGILGKVRPLPDDDPEYYAYRPVTAVGKPISETIIEERG